MISFRFFLGILFTMTLTTCGGGSPSPPIALPPPVIPPPQTLAALSTRFVIDGIVDFSVFNQTMNRIVQINDNLGTGVLVREITVEWGILNDDRDIYLAVRWSDPTHNNNFNQGPIDVDLIKLSLDSNNNGLLDENDDEHMVIASASSSHYVDQHYVAGVDVEDLIGDGQARLKYDSSSMEYTAEFLIPRTDDKNGEDGIIDSTTAYNLVFTDTLKLPAITGNMGSLFSSTVDASTWSTMEITAGDLFDHPEIPSGLTGLIAFISDHESGPNGDLYTFEPATGIVNRVTNLPNLFKDNLSLSHDRTRITFHGSNDKALFNQYEIYSINIDGTGLTQLTSNNVLDGHPAWSPDDSNIAYASFREPDAESIIVMSFEGIEINEIAVPGASDNDPEYTPDGKIVFKTNRFSTAPNLRIAVMNEDGSGVVQVTNISGKSDHDPFTNNTHIVFERFTKDTDFSLNLDFINAGWDIIQVQIDGSNETNLLADGWVNWLPLYDPSNQFIVYQKTLGAYTEVRIMDLNGNTLGRFIPDITKIRYIDWK